MTDLLTQYLGSVLIGMAGGSVVFSIMQFIKPKHDKKMIVKLVKCTVKEELDELKAMIANLATVMDIRLDTLEEKQRIKQNLLDEIGVGRQYIHNADFLKFYNYYMSTVVDLSMRFFEGKLNDVKQYEMVKAHIDVKMEEVTNTISSMLGQTFADSFIKISDATMRMWIQEVYIIFADPRDNKISRMRTLNIKLIQDIIQDMFVIGDKLSILGNVPQK